MEIGQIKVFFKNKYGIFRKILSKEEYEINKNGKIILPKNHYSKGYIERIIDGAEWESYPLYDTIKE
jgi:hypothetical protein